jgi:hypothetical protein
MRHMLFMDTNDFCERAAKILGGHGWRTRLAAITGKDYATIKRWANGQQPVPDYAASIVELLELVPAESFERLPERFQARKRRTASAGA